MLPCNLLTDSAFKELSLGCWFYNPSWKGRPLTCCAAEEQDQTQHEVKHVCSDVCSGSRCLGKGNSILRRESERWTPLREWSRAAAAGLRSQEVGELGRRPLVRWWFIHLLGLASFQTHWHDHQALALPRHLGNTHSTIVFSSPTHSRVMAQYSDPMSGVWGMSIGGKVRETAESDRSKCTVSGRARLPVSVTRYRFGRCRLQIWTLPSGYLRMWGSSISTVS